MKKIILALGVGVLFATSSLMAGQQNEVEEVLGLMSLKNGQPNGCIGYGAGIIEGTNADGMTLKYSRHGHKLTVTCTIPAPPE